MVFINRSYFLSGEPRRQLIHQVLWHSRLLVRGSVLCPCVLLHGGGLYIAVHINTQPPRGRGKLEVWSDSLNGSGIAWVRWLTFMCPAYEVFLSVPVRLFPGETITRISAGTKAAFCPHVGGHQLIIWVPEQNRGGGKEGTLLNCICWVLGPRDSTSFPECQVVESR